ncbi:MAG: serine/threonine-protein kinase [Verrucomicrobia bacterium]|nr:serine/threonine-protein kinase [Verrucomicrobiota bacterium]
MGDSIAPPSAFVAPQPAELAPLFPGYEIDGLIAIGGMGAVYRAVQKSLERTVAIKILPQEFSKDAAFCAGFEAEAKAMARLNHPNLVAVYDFGEVHGMLYIIMEYVPGKSLFQAAHGIALNAGETIRLVTGICNGLAHAHENGIIHRDIKPSNILLDLNGHPKIGDFGLARPVEKKIQENDAIFGTPDYTAPEVVHSPQSVDHRADIFSVGVILHELLTGRLPAADRRPASAIVRGDLRFDAIIRRATDPLPERRYAKALEIVKDLRAINSSAGSRVFRTNSAASSMDLRRTAVAMSGAATAPRTNAPAKPRRTTGAAPGASTAPQTSAPAKPRRTTGAAPGGMAAAPATSTLAKHRQLPIAPIKPVSPKEKSAIIPLIIMLVLAIIILASSLYFFSKIQKIRQDREEKSAPDHSREPYIPVAKPKPKAR